MTLGYQNNLLQSLTVKQDIIIKICIKMEVIIYVPLYTNRKMFPFR